MPFLMLIFWIIVTWVLYVSEKRSDYKKRTAMAEHIQKYEEEKKRRLDEAMVEYKAKEKEMYDHIRKERKKYKRKIYEDIQKMKADGMDYSLIRHFKELEEMKMFRYLMDIEQIYRESM